MPEEGESRPKTTGSLRVNSGRNFPDGFAWMMRSLKELVPMSMEAKRSVLI